MCVREREAHTFSMLVWKEQIERDQVERTDYKKSSRKTTATGDMIIKKKLCFFSPWFR